MLRWRRLSVVCALSLAVPVLGVVPPAAGASVRATSTRRVPAADQAFLTLLFGRNQWGPADNCQLVQGGVDLDQIAAAFKALHVNGVGAVIVDRTNVVRQKCVHGIELYPTWTQISQLRVDYGWSFISGGLSHSGVNITKLTPKQQYTESCGTLTALAAHGDTRAWGLFAYPDNHYDDEVQQDVVSKCFAYGRTYGQKVNEESAMAPPWFQKTFSLHGGSCNNPQLHCYNSQVSAGQRYMNPAALAQAMHPTSGQWAVVQGYRFVTGARPHPANGPAWDCSGSNWTSHWTNEDELYCWNDYLGAVKKIPSDVTVTDPATVATLWGRNPQGPQPLSSIADTTAVSDGRVDAIAQSDGTAYIGGTFHEVGPNTGAGVVLGQNSGGLSKNSPIVDGTVDVAVPDGAGGWYIGGDITSVNGKNVGKATDIRSNGSFSPAWKARPNKTVDTIVDASSLGEVFLGGDFTTLRHVPATYLAAVNPKTGTIVTTFAPVLNGPVSAMALAGPSGPLYVAGSFTTADGRPAAGLVAVNPRSGALEAAQPAAVAGGTVDTMTASNDGTEIFLGGSFTSVGSQARHGLAALVAATGRLSSWAPVTNGIVDTMTESADSTKLYVGGTFTSVNGATADLLAALSPTTGSTVTSFAPGIADSCLEEFPGAPCTPAVRTVTLAGSEVVAAGDFETVHGTAERRIAAVDGASGALDTAFTCDMNGPVLALAISAGALFAGGSFTGVNGSTRDGLAAIDTSFGTLLPLDLPIDGSVSSLAVSPSGSTLYVGGVFTSICGVAASDLAAVNLASGTVDAAFGARTDGNVDALVATANALFVGGAFRHVDGLGLHHIAELNPITGAADAAWKPGADNLVTSLALSPNGTTLYAGGSFLRAGGRHQAALVAIGVSSGVATTWSPSAPQRINALGVSPDGATVCAGSGRGTATITCYSAATGHADWQLHTTGPVYSLAVTATAVYAGGAFHYVISGTTETKVGRAVAIGLTTGTLGTWTPRFNSGAGVLAMVATPTALLTGGDFTVTGREDQSGFALFSGTP